MSQLPLVFDSPASRIEQAFWAFHTAHPDVYEILVALARQWRERKGASAQVGIGALYERARWEVQIESLTDVEPPRLSNNHRAFYSRLIMKQHPDLANIFKLKQQKHKSTLEGDGDDGR